MRALFVALLVLAAYSPAEAHDARPLSVEIVEETGYVYRVRIRIPPTVEFSNRPTIEWPAGCVPGADRTGVPIGFSSFGGVMMCAGSLEGRTISFHYPQFNPSLSTVVRFSPLDGAVRMAVLTPAVSEWTVPSRPSRARVAMDYTGLGIEHILGGWDHLLFVVGLLMLAGSARRIFWVVTGFTLAHSVTLSLSALGVLAVPVVPVEAAIALSILFLAREIAVGRPQSLANRYPFLVSSSFGLLHGLGFAAALSEIGLVSGELLTSLFSFNVGVEVGQILVILPILSVAWLAGRGRVAHRFPGLGRLRPALPTVCSYAIGVPAAFWFIERVTTLIL